MCAGVLNGIDMQEWNPRVDPKIYTTYSMANLKAGKAANKLALQKELSLAQRPEVWSRLYHARQARPAVVSTASSGRSQTSHAATSTT